MFIKLTYNGPYTCNIGMPEYIDSRRITLIEDDVSVYGREGGSYVHVDCGSDTIVHVKEKPEEIIAMINDGDFCMYSKECPSDESEFIFSRGEQGVE